MSASYQHVFAVRDLAWRPTKAHAEAVHQVLLAWGLVDQKPVLTVVEGPRSRKLTGRAVVRAAAIPEELVLFYFALAEGEAAARILGPLEAGSPREQPSVTEVRVILGRDFKVLTALIDGDREVHRNATVGFEVVSATWEDAPPPTEVAVRNPWSGALSQGTTGLMRSGVVLFCDEACPAFARARPGSGVPNRDFVRALEAAFGTRLAEVGRYV